MGQDQTSTYPPGTRAGANPSDSPRPTGYDLPIGVHRGMLAGLSEEDRTWEVGQYRGYDEKACPPLERKPLRCAYGYRTAYDAIKQDPPTDLEGYLLSTTKSELNAIAARIGIEKPGKMLKVDLARELAVALPAHVEILEQALIACDDEQYETFRLLLDTPGTAIAYQDVRRGECPNIAPLPPFTKLFKRGRDFKAGMPPQVVEMVRKLDLAAIEDTRQRDVRIVHTAQVMTDLAGVVGLAEVAVRCEELFGFCPEADEMEDALIEAYRDYARSVSYVPLGAWRTGDVKFLLAAECAQGARWRTCDEDSMQRIWSLMPWMTEAKGIEGCRDGLSENQIQDVLVSRLLSDQAYWERLGRLEIDGCLAEMSVIEWEKRLPEIADLRNWLDAHVPDRMDDYQFADTVIDDLLRRRSVRIDFTAFAGRARELDLFRLAPDVEEFCSLLAKAMCALPSWRYGGRSAHTVGKLLASARVEHDERCGEHDDGVLASVA